jgi:hypothetical protein
MSMKNHCQSVMLTWPRSLKDVGTAASQPRDGKRQEDYFFGQIGSANADDGG